MAFVKAWSTIEKVDAVAPGDVLWTLDHRVPKCRWGLGN
ncbi:hypothetical protein FHS38_007083 [Streptomyces netropsis]|uniref:Uncharacterized protein n=1 Tax=Streptomyces netropsis TaxID=55404 RepID=A0A7W7PID0_STRNE|nr:hypothetical protein [Streptomyces netropsis]